MEEADFLKAVIAAAIDGIILIDAEGRIELFNPACVKLFGYQPDEVIGRNVNMLMPEPYHSEHDGYIARYRGTGEKRIIGIGREVIGRRKDGSTFPFELAVNVFGRGGRQMFVGFIHDVTARNKAEEQLRQAQKAEALGQLTSGIAHDFNNLLAVIIGNLELLSDRVTDEAGRKLIDLALRSGLRGAELTQRLLAFGRQQKLKPQRIDANKLITNLVDLMRRTLGEAVVIDTALATDLLPIEADPGQLENALINLALNARDAMPGGGRLTLRTANSDTTPDPAAAAGRYVLISISDTGTGMTDEVRARVFEPFFTTKETGKGTGLGLSMVYGFITQSGGFVRIESAPGRGTEVRLYLPGSARAEEKASAPPAAIDAKTVLAVEDNPDVRATTVAMLQMLGYSVVTAASGAEAMDTLRRLPHIALMYTDVVMPGGMTGPELAEAALSLRPDLPVIFTSGSADDTHFRNTRFYGRVPLLRKPVRKHELGAALARALKGAGAKE